MAIPNVETTASRADYDVRTHKSNSKPHNAQAKTERPSGGNPPKEDTVTISEEGRKRFIEKGTPEWEKYRETYVSDLSTKKYLTELSLEDKNGQGRGEVANQLASLILNSSDTDLETRAANREAARDLAKYIAENYMSDPKEAQAFIDKINKYIEDAELVDKGYVDKGKGLEPPEPPSQDERLWAANWDKYLGHLGIAYKDGSSVTQLLHNGSPEEREAVYAMLKDCAAESIAYARKVNTPYKFWPDGSEGPSWEETKEMNCDPRFSMYSEENKAWYKDFLAKSNLVQNIIDNAKLITDFSGNEKWNIVMNLLTLKQGEK
jgi:hypothetical protein